ncbi:MarR family winged helix-turn-helix transcriptional regulator [Salinisphaera aquimarina]|uniref:MarR family winged helix-turn-helix transcriptional regulator n=1 Tax=Salinisphaera aquimarina TaxID=2094031 RepID=A0ABV7EQ61_9GAMM
MASRSNTSPLCPDGRLSSPASRRHGRMVVNLENYIPYYLVSVNNALSRGASRQYLARFGVGIVEWRVISMLAIEPDIPAARVCEVVALDKAATSRALQRLNKLGYTQFEARERDPRAKTWRLSEAGLGLHDQLLTAALAREQRLIQDIEPEKLEVFLEVIRAMHHNLDVHFEDRAAVADD